MIYPEKFAQQWIDAWNARDLETLLSFYADNIQLRSPFAKVYASGGLIKNKTELEKYWGEAMRRMPNLNLSLVSVYTGHLAMSLHYLDNTGRHVIETMTFDDRDKVVTEVACLDRPR